MKWERFIKVALWLAFSCVNYGASLGAFQGRFPDEVNFNQRYCREDMGMASFLAMTGPIGFLPVTFLSGYYEHGFKWSCK
jgi:hypothetical protein